MTLKERMAMMNAAFDKSKPERLTTPRGYVPPKTNAVNRWKSSVLEKEKDASNSKDATKIQSPGVSVAKSKSIRDRAKATGLNFDNAKPIAPTGVNKPPVASWKVKTQESSTTEAVPASGGTSRTSNVTDSTSSSSSNSVPSKPEPVKNPAPTAPTAGPTRSTSPPTEAREIVTSPSLKAAKAKHLEDRAKATGLHFENAKPIAPSKVYASTSSSSNSVPKPAPMMVVSSASSSSSSRLGEIKIDKEVERLRHDIARLGTVEGDDIVVTYGRLFDDEKVQQTYEAIMGTLKAARKRKLIDFKGQILLKGAHDSTEIRCIGGAKLSKSSVVDQDVTVSNARLIEGVSTGKVEANAGKVGVPTENAEAPVKMDKVPKEVVEVPSEKVVATAVDNKVDVPSNMVEALTENTTCDVDVEVAAPTKDKPCDEDTEATLASTINSAEFSSDSESTQQGKIESNSSESTSSSTSSSRQGANDGNSEKEHESQGKEANLDSNLSSDDVKTNEKNGGPEQKQSNFTAKLNSGDLTPASKAMVKKTIVDRVDENSGLKAAEAPQQSKFTAKLNSGDLTPASKAMVKKTIVDRLEENVGIDEARPAKVKPKDVNISTTEGARQANEPGLKSSPTPRASIADRLKMNMKTTAPLVVNTEAESAPGGISPTASIAESISKSPTPSVAESIKSFSKEAPKEASSSDSITLTPSVAASIKSFNSGGQPSKEESTTEGARQANEPGLKSSPTPRASIADRLKMNMKTTAPLVVNTEAESAPGGISPTASIAESISKSPTPSVAESIKSFSKEAPKEASSSDSITLTPSVAASIKSFNSGGQKSKEEKPIFKKPTPRGSVADRWKANIKSTTPAVRATPKAATPKAATPKETAPKGTGPKAAQKDAPKAPAAISVNTVAEEAVNSNRPLSIQDRIRMMQNKNPPKASKDEKAVKKSADTASEKPSEAVAVSEKADVRMSIRQRVIALHAPPLETDAKPRSSVETMQKFLSGQSAEASAANASPSTLPKKNKTKAEVTPDAKKTGTSTSTPTDEVKSKVATTPPVTPNDHKEPTNIATKTATEQNTTPVFPTPDGSNPPNDKSTDQWLQQNYPYLKENSFHSDSESDASNPKKTNGADDANIVGGNNDGDGNKPAMESNYLDENDQEKDDLFEDVEGKDSANNGKGADAVFAGNLNSDIFDDLDVGDDDIAAARDEIFDDLSVSSASHASKAEQEKVSKHDLDENVPGNSANAPSVPPATSSQTQDSFWGEQAKASNKPDINEYLHDQLNKKREKEAPEQEEDKAVTMKAKPFDSKARRKPAADEDSFTRLDKEQDRLWDKWDKIDEKINEHENKKKARQPVAVSPEKRSGLANLAREISNVSLPSTKKSERCDDESSQGTTLTEAERIKNIEKSIIENHKHNSDSRAKRMASLTAEHVIAESNAAEARMAGKSPMSPFWKSPGATNKNSMTSLINSNDRNDADSAVERMNDALNSIKKDAAIAEIRKEEGSRSKNSKESAKLRKKLEDQRKRAKRKVDKDQAKASKLENKLNSKKERSRSQDASRSRSRSKGKSRSKSRSKSKSKSKSKKQAPNEERKLSINTTDISIDMSMEDVNTSRKSPAFMLQERDPTYEIEAVNNEPSSPTKDPNQKRSGFRLSFKKFGKKKDKTMKTTSKSPASTSGTSKLGAKEDGKGDTSVPVQGNDNENAGVDGDTPKSSTSPRSEASKKAGFLGALASLKKKKKRDKEVVQRLKDAAFSPTSEVGGSAISPVSVHSSPGKTSTKPILSSKEKTISPISAKSSPGTATKSILSSKENKQGEELQSTSNPLIKKYSTDVEVKQNIEVAAPGCTKSPVIAMKSKKAQSVSSICDNDIEVFERFKKLMLKDGIRVLKMSKNGVWEKKVRDARKYKYCHAT